MKKLSLCLLFCIIIFFTSCSSMVTVQFVEPAEIDLSNYKNLAIAPTKKCANVIRNFDVKSVYSYHNIYQVSSGIDTSRINDTLATRVNNYLNNEAGFFNFFQKCMNSSETEKYLNGSTNSYLGLAEDGWDIILISEISELQINQELSFYESRDYKTKQINYDNCSYRYYCYCHAVVSYRFIETATGRVIYSGYLIDRKTSSGDDFFLKSTVIEWGAIQLASSGINFTDIINSIVSDISSRIEKEFVGKFVPHTSYSKISIYPNKPKNENAEQWYKAMDKGIYKYAMEGFLDVWKEDKHIPSGYNAALLFFASGNSTKGISILEEILSYQYDEDVAILLQEFKDIYSAENEAQKQIDKMNSN